MRTIFTIFFCICFVINSNGQISKTLNLSAGNLSSALTSSEKQTITNLILTGTIDARDFKFIRDSLTLKSVDLNGVKIVSYSDTLEMNSDNIYFNANVLPESAFEDCHDLESVILPSSIINIERWAFDYCTSLETVNIPDSVKIIGEEAFDYCIKLKSIYIPANTDSINSTAFRRSSGYVTVDENNRKFSSHDGVLFNKQKTELIFCPISKTGNYTIPSLVSKIGDDSFDDCSNLTSINIPNSVKYIGIEAFYDCSGLDSINIPKSVTNIESSAFSGCTNLSAIQTNSEIPIDLEFCNDVFEWVNLNTCKLYIPKGSRFAYLNAHQWKDFQNIIEVENFTSIQNVNFSDTFKISVSDNTITVQCSIFYKNSNMMIYNTNGTPVYSENIIKEFIEIQVEKPGIYIICIRDNQKNRFSKVYVPGKF